MKNLFTLESAYKPTGDQPEAIETLTNAVKRGVKEQVLLGVTGSGKTFTMANLIANAKRPALIISHNKTLAAQLYQEFRDYFPTNAVSYFVSYYDYYQPEAYIPQSNTYIEKETVINEEIDKLRLATTTNLLTRPDCIVVASVSCIYNIGSPKEYGNFILTLKVGEPLTPRQIATRLVELQYSRNDMGFTRGTFRMRGDTVDIYPAYQDECIRVVVGDTGITVLESLDLLTGKKIATLDGFVVYPAKHYMTNPKQYKEVFGQIRADMEAQVKKFTDAGQFIEAQRIKERVTHDLEMVEELGYVNGIENYSRYFDGRKVGDPPYSLLDYFEQESKGKWLLFVDESHITMPQIRGMYQGDRSRKQTLIDYGFRLPSALDNRPLRIDEFMRRMPETVYVSATPDEWELSRVKERDTPVVEQLLRPTGLIDPMIDVRPSKGQIEDLLKEIELRVTKKERVLVTTLTKRIAEDLTKYLAEKNIKVQYLHADVETLTRSDILADLRRGVFDVVIGINLLREGLDLPEVSLVAILDADKEGFLRSTTSLIQTMGRAARHINGQVILYADKHTQSMKRAIDEVTRRRNYQLAHNREHNVTPLTINKPIRDRMTLLKEPHIEYVSENLLSEDELGSMTPLDKKRQIKLLTERMKAASRDMNFELAAHVRDQIQHIKITL
ncbi:MAG: excinuclease ABC subunit UvrB [Patescibacteria group bacterium]